MGRTPEFLVVGHVTKAHGTKGELFVWPLTDRPEDVFAPGSRVLVGDEHGELGPTPPELVVASSRPYKRGLLAQFEGIGDRNAAEALASLYLLAPSSELPGPEPDELYYHQLLGLEVETVDGERVGKVREVYETEPTHMLEVKGEAKVHLIPLAGRIVKKVDVEAGRLVIKPPPGLLDL